MEIILKQDVDKLGYKNDIVNVRPGYANNFLIPQGHAILATKSARKVLAENIKQSSHKEAKQVENANTLAAKIAETAIVITAKASEGGKIFGSVTSMQIAEALEAKGFAIERKNIIVDSVKTVGAYNAVVKIYKNITVTLDFSVVAEAE